MLVQLGASMAGKHVGYRTDFGDLWSRRSIVDNELVILFKGRRENWVEEGFARHPMW